MKSLFISIILITLSFSINIKTPQYLVDQLKGNIKEITVKELNKKLKDKTDDFLIIDVREKVEWLNGHIDDDRVKNIPRGLLEWKVYKIDPYKEIIVLCQKGGRGVLSANSLQEMGFTNVKNLKGGFDNWKANCDIKREEDIFMDIKQTPLNINVKQGCNL